MVKSKVCRHINVPPDLIAQNMVRRFVFCCRELCKCLVWLLTTEEKCQNTCCHQEEKRWILKLKCWENNSCFVPKGINFCFGHAISWKVFEHGTRFSVFLLFCLCSLFAKCVLTKIRSVPWIKYYFYREVWRHIWRISEETLWQWWSRIPCEKSWRWKLVKSQVMWASRKQLYA